MRGALTDSVTAIALERIGRPISLRELRMIPYVQYVMVNEQKIDPMRISPDERRVLSLWRKEGHIQGGASGVSITKEFWNFMCAILYESYVNI